ncbi:MAG TPA: glucokinase [Oculatellaceae cyanobacterium]
MEKNDQMILAGDIGGTNTRLAYFERADDGCLSCMQQGKYSSQEFTNLTDIVHDFIKEHKIRITHAAFGVAGPVVNGVVHATNLPWVVALSDLKALLDTQDVHLLNDLEANTWGISVLHEDDFIFLNRGNPSATGNAAVISPGTGLGEAGLFWDGKEYHPFACEGGHADFSPRDPLQVELLDYLMRDWEHVSWERVLSGPGLFNIYRFLRDTGRGDEPSWLADKMKAHDAGKVITESAMAGTSELCENTVDLFCALYGSEAGNLALKTMALGGIYLGGGIAPKILPRLKEGAFLREFTEKGRMKQLLQGISVRLILNENAALLGAAHYAATQASRKLTVKT